MQDVSQMSVTSRYFGGSPVRGSSPLSERSYTQFGSRGGKFSNSKPKSDVDWAIYRAKQLPGVCREHERLVLSHTVWSRRYNETGSQFPWCLVQIRHLLERNRSVNLSQTELERSPYEFEGVLVPATSELFTPFHRKTISPENYMLSK